MGIPTVIAAAGFGLQAYGMAKQVSSAKAQANASRDAIAAQQKAESARQQQLNLDANRRRREAIRQGVIARSVALANATSQGAQDSSGLAGGYGQISGRTGTNILGVNQNQALGNDIFGFNREVGAAQSRQAYYQGQGALGQGLSSLGGSLLTNIKPLTNVGTFIAGSLYPQGFDQRTGYWKY